MIASLEADLRNANQNLTTTQTENTQIKNRLEHLQEDVKNLTAINATLEKRLEIEQNSVSLLALSGLGNLGNTRSKLSLKCTTTLEIGRLANRGSYPSTASRF